MPKATIFTALFAAGLTAAAAVSAQTPEEFFKGKTITIYVGLSAGGGYDLNARLLARYLGKHTPGNPTVVVKNMPGGGGLVMTNYVANAALKDGLHIGALQRGLPFEPMLGDASNAKYDPLKLNWLGSINADTSVAIASKRSGIKTMQDLQKKELIVGGSGVGTETVTVPYVLRNILGFQYKVISGYPGSTEIMLAMQRGEVDGKAVSTWTSLKPTAKQMAEDGTVILYQMGLRKHPELPHVPLVSDFATTEDQKNILELQFTALELGRPYVLAEGVAADRVTALRRAFDAAMKDKDLLADAEKQGLEINPVTGEEMHKILTRVYATPKVLVDRLAEASKDTTGLKQLPPAEKKAGEKAAQ